MEKVKVETGREIPKKYTREELIWHLFNITNELGEGSIKSTAVKDYIDENLK